MANNTASERERWGPDIYVHLEFRFAWFRKQQPKNHQLTYRSRGARQRASAFPRQVPAPNTNYLAAIHDFEQRQTRIREFRHSYARNHPNWHHQMQEYYQVEQQSGHPPVPVIREPEPRPEPERPTRADGRPSQGRGSSAPPPIGENPWDVSVPQGEETSGPDTTFQNRPWAEIRRKPLPAPPSQFRLGEGRDPWSTWSLPVGFDPDLLPKEEDQNESEAGDLPTRSEGPAVETPTAYATNPTMVSTFSPEPNPTMASTLSPAPTITRRRDLETGRARELGALSAAMMTVDNGFENQWWYQGKRQTVIETADDDDGQPRTPPPAAESPLVHRWSAGPVTMTMASTTPPPPGPSTPEPSWRAQPPTTTGVVSPLTEVALSPAPASALQRSLSTRSEELWLRER
ncbi:hypothetical protein VTK56DRAFT_5575 [Thermocarpiscus australiensis]